jgi:hypothetical protein
VRRFWGNALIQIRLFQRFTDTRYTGYKTDNVGIIKDIEKRSELQNQCSGEELSGEFL